MFTKIYYIINEIGRLIKVITSDRNYIYTKCTEWFIMPHYLKGYTEFYFRTDKFVM